MSNDKKVISMSEWWEVLFDQYCRWHCPDRDERQYYGRFCPNCGAMAFSDWLQGEVFKVLQIEKGRGE